ncbi:MAG: RdgB/HAM1 family non-canonical purine NTP pyrophosphatase [Sphingomonadaceae bacterium]|uniref:RdgB/HAM1 family non-canonical purine NTP pyrophosphatase n=1 Tax=Thermaurantiacus sp. TaxID=2820283 RepID=UPI00298EE9B8|nr:RdgB/HAM1 family non-canonical purine NTP pyrophosphatase [Thermaurantiacus sp.]MCS6986993.1 RdgB/HAM1 family non-canonical purine NTP pyrophosphatase [Sphingomonadaceae bacterium]MDW8415669.1 RdgB/HAM1 family non-canonical purine NTP pyrophosphatase [Thermaurantiacus sp.]
MSGRLAMAPGARLVVATHNPGKLREMADLLAPLGIPAVGAQELGLPVPDETETSFAGNALLKARAAARASGLPALADDSGLCADALGGAPGVHTADWAETGCGRDWMLAMRRLEEALRALGPGVSRQARFVCALALVIPGDGEAVFEGVCPGRLVWPPRGDRGFGYDPMFVPDGENETFGEMEPERKHRMSHRAAAFAKLVAALRPV